MMYMLHSTKRHISLTWGVSKESGNEQHAYTHRTYTCTRQFTHTHTQLHTYRTLHADVHTSAGHQLDLSLPWTVAHAKSFSVAYLHYQWVLTTVPPIDTATTYSSTYPNTILIAEFRLQLLCNYKLSRSRWSIAAPSYVIWYWHYWNCWCIAQHYTHTLRYESNNPTL